VQHNRASIFSHGDVCTTPRSRGRAVALASFLSLRAAELTADMSDVLSAATSVQSFGGRSAETSKSSSHGVNLCVERLFNFAGVVEGSYLDGVRKALGAVRLRVGLPTGCIITW
jgi:hypothetical protein